jgi:hypothetical protein
MYVDQTVDIADVCKEYGWNQACCQCIVTHESSGDANAANENTNGSFDVGVWQINSGNWASWYVLRLYLIDDFIMPVV